MLYWTQRLESAHYSNALMQDIVAKEHRCQYHLSWGPRRTSSNATLPGVAQHRQTQSGRRVQPRSSPSQLGTIKLFSIYSGTAGQEGLNIMERTIKCPTKLSHFWDGWDNKARVTHLRVIRRGQYTTWVRTAQRGFGPEGVTLTFFQGHGTWDKTGTVWGDIRFENLPNQRS